MSAFKAPAPQIVIVMGVAGVGKTTVGRRLADRLGWSFLDADDFHPEANVRKMRSGIPLTDADRKAWLARLRAEIETHLLEKEPAVLACSALKSAYRDQLTNGSDGVVFVYLRASRKVVEERLSSRTGHFFDAALLASQFATLEEPDTALIIDASLDVEQIVSEIAATLDAPDGN